MTHPPLTSRARALATAVAAGALVLGAAACGGDDDDDAAQFCERYRSYEEANRDFARDAVSDDTDTELDLDTIKEQAGEERDQVRNLADVAPEEISDDMDAVAAAIEEQVEQIEAAEGPADLADASTDVVDDTDLQEASDRIEAWTIDNCASDGDTQ